MRWPWQRRNGEARAAARREVEQQQQAAQEQQRKVDRARREVDAALEFADRVRRAYRGVV